MLLGLADLGGYGAWWVNLVATDRDFPPARGQRVESHRFPMPTHGDQWFGMVMGLGFVLSFGWCCDFPGPATMAAESISAATSRRDRRPKMFPALVILPGIIAVALHFGGLGRVHPTTRDSSTAWPCHRANATSRRASSAWPDVDGVVHVGMAAT